MLQHQHFGPLFCYPDRAMQGHSPISGVPQFGAQFSPLTEENNISEPIATTLVYKITFEELTALLVVTNREYSFIEFFSKLLFYLICLFILNSKYCFLEYTSTICCQQLLNGFELSVSMAFIFAPCVFETWFATVSSPGVTTLLEGRVYDLMNFVRRIVKF